MLHVLLHRILLIKHFLPTLGLISLLLGRGGFRAGLWEGATILNWTCMLCEPLPSGGGHGLLGSALLFSIELEAGPRLQIFQNFTIHFHSFKTRQLNHFEKIQPPFYKPKNFKILKRISKLTSKEIKTNYGFPPPINPGPI